MVLTFREYCLEDRHKLTPDVFISNVRIIILSGKTLSSFCCIPDSLLSDENNTVTRTSEMLPCIAHIFQLGMMEVRNEWMQTVNK